MATQSKYFKFRGRFDFSPHHFEIGNPIRQNRALADNFFLKKLCQLYIEEFSPYYNFHLDFFSERYPGQAEEFFNHVTDIVINRIAFYKKRPVFIELSQSHGEREATVSFP